jgi:hypothetical protein
MTQKKKKNPGSSNREIANTIMLLLEATGRTINLETHDGSVREGRLTGFDCRKMIINGRPVDLPITLELNSDSTDHIELAMIAKLDIA